MFVDYNQLVLTSEEPHAITFRKGSALVNTFPIKGIFGYAKIQAPSKPNTPKPAASAISSKFLSLIKENDELSLSMCRHAPNMYFDVRQSSLIADGVALKRYPFIQSPNERLENRGIKQFCVHKDHIVVATFR
jgi:hypothetical protein